MAKKRMKVADNVSPDPFSCQYVEGISVNHESILFRQPKTIYIVSHSNKISGLSYSKFNLDKDNNIKLQHPVTLRRSHFAFRFFAVHVQRR
jgi:hypothetical protein